MNITVEELVNNIDKYIIIDVRSPKEYEAGTIYNAINIPILDDEARHIIGTLYASNKDEAYREGLKVGTSRLPFIYDEISNLKKENPTKEVVIFCFRGGTRSSSVVNVMNMLKMSCYKLVGGHKEYRTYILGKLDSYVSMLNFLVVTGNTGSGKTIVLNKLSSNYPVLDLEDYANHRGSIFGDIGLVKVSQKTFEDRLFYSLKKLIDANNKYVFIESESRKIGDISLSNLLFDKIMTSPHLLLDVSLEKRVSILLDVYKVDEVDIFMVKSLVSGNEYFKVLLGSEWVDKMIDFLDEKDFNSFIRHMLVDYYDKLYLKSQNKYTYDLTIKSDDLDQIVLELSNYYNNLLD